MEGGAEGGVRDSGVQSIPGPARSPGEIGLSDIGQPSGQATLTLVRSEPPPEYSSQTSSSDDDGDANGHHDDVWRSRRRRERQRLLGLGETPAYRDIVRERSPGVGPGRYRSGSAPAGPSTGSGGVRPIG